MWGLKASNRLGFILLGLINNLVLALLLSAAFELHKNQSRASDTSEEFKKLNLILNNNNHHQQDSTRPELKCRSIQSISTIILVAILPALAIKIIHPFVLASKQARYQVIVVALLSAAAFFITGLFKRQPFIFIGLAIGSLSYGLGESTFLSITPRYGDVSLSGWSIGVGLASFFGSIIFALLRMVLSVQEIMMLLLVLPIILLVIYFQFITKFSIRIDEDIRIEYRPPEIVIGYPEMDDEFYRPSNPEPPIEYEFNFCQKLRYLSSLAKYFFPLLLVVFAESLVFRALFILIHYPKIEYLNKAAQFTCFRRSYQFGAMIAHGTLELIQFKHIWLLTGLQFVNVLIFLAHTARLICVPSFYLMVALVIYQGVIGGLTYVNTFYRVKREVRRHKQEYSMSFVAIGDVLGNVMAELVALPVHNALCELYV